MLLSAKAASAVRETSFLRFNGNHISVKIWTRGLKKIQDSQSNTLMTSTTTGEPECLKKKRTQLNFKKSTKIKENKNRSKTF